MTDQSPFETDMVTLNRYVMEKGRRVKGATGELTLLNSTIRIRPANLFLMS
uniref:Uncharacterized protein n=1 Tax=Naja naja TaxID=35670 RepID=A0A8C7E6F1_NAJNA